jgi:hypothetical protein
MDPNAPMSWLDMPPSYDGPTQFAPAIPDTRNPYSFTATRDRAFQLEQMKQQEAQMRLQSILEEKRRQREADQAMPFLQALDPTADTYSEQRRKALLSLPPSALTNPHVQNLVRDQDYLHRSSSRSTDDPRVAKVLAEDPGQFETYQDDLEKLTPKEAANRLWARHNDNKLKVELASSGYDGDFNDLLGERGYIDPVKAALWKNKNGVRNQAMTEDDRDKLLKELGDTIIKRNDPTSPPEYKAVADARIASLQARLGEAAPKMTGTPAAPVTTSPTGPISTEEAPKYWQESKKELAKHFMEAAGGDAQKFSQMLGNPEAARNALSTLPQSWQTRVHLPARYLHQRRRSLGRSARSTAPRPGNGWRYGWQLDGRDRLRHASRSKASTPIS